MGEINVVVHGAITTSSHDNDRVNVSVSTKG